METPPNDFRFVGRSNELAVLHAALDEARAGRTSLVLVGGESGIGKTRLVAEAIERFGDGLVLLNAAALDVAELPPLWPVIDALRRLFEGPERHWAFEAVAPWRAQLARLLTGVTDEALAAGAHPVPPDDELPGVDLLCRAVSSLAAARPVLLTIDDLQWADRSTRDFLVYTLAAPLDCALAILVTYRTGPSGRSDSLVQLLPELRRNRRVQAMDLAPLDEPDISDLVESALGSRLSALEEKIWRRSAGNPFIAEQTLRAHVAGDGEDVPQTLRQMVLGRVDALPKHSALILGAVATAGEPVDHDLLGEVVGLDPPELLAAIRAAVEASLIAVDRASDGYCFRHGLYQEVVAAELLPGERRELHRGFAEALSRRPNAADPRMASRLAFHWDRGREWPRALEATLAAAAYAQSLRGHVEATRHWTRAVELLEVAGTESLPVERTRVLEDAAESATLAGEHELAVELMRRRIELERPGDEAAAARLHQRLAYYLSAAGNVKEALGEHEQAVGLGNASPDLRLRAQVLGGYAEALLLAGNFSAARREAEQAVAWAEEARASDEQSRALATLGFSLACLADPIAGIDALERALAIAEASGQAEDLGRGFVRLAELLAGPLNRLDEAIEVARRGASRVGALGLERTFGVELRAIAANALFRLGRWAEADGELSTALAAKPTGTSAIELRLAKARLLVGWGEIEEAEEELEALDLLCADSVGPRYRAPVLTLKAGLALWQGDPGTACAAVAAGLALTTPESDDIWLLTPLVWHGLRAVADEAERLQSRVVAGSISASEGLIGEQGGYELLFVEYMHLLMERAAGAPDPLAGSVDAYLQLCEGERDRARGRPDPALWLRAARLWEHNGHPYPTAYCWYRHADAELRHRARSAEGSSSLRRAHEVALALGARPLVAEITTLAGRARIALNAPEADKQVIPSGAAPGLGPTLAFPAFEGLTERERTVLAELAEGRTNKEIAQRLFISDKTVSAHLSHIFEKLGVHSRVQATSLWHRASTPAP